MFDGKLWRNRCLDEITIEIVSSSEVHILAAAIAAAIGECGQHGTGGSVAVARFAYREVIQ